MNRFLVRPIIILFVAAAALYVLAPLSYKQIRKAQRASKLHKAQLEDIANFEGSWLLDSHNNPTVDLIDDNSINTYEFPKAFQVSAEKWGPIEGNYLIDIRNGANPPDIITKPSFGVSKCEDGYLGGATFFKVLFCFSENGSVMELFMAVDQRSDSFTMKRVATYYKEQT